MFDIQVQKHHAFIKNSVAVTSIHDVFVFAKNKKIPHNLGTGLESNKATIFWKQETTIFRKEEIEEKKITPLTPVPISCGIFFLCNSSSSVVLSF